MNLSLDTDPTTQLFSTNPSATGSSNATIAALRGLQTILGLISTLQITSPVYPANYEVEDNQTFDYIIVGAGAAGCVLANRLTENSEFSVLAIEAGGNPPLESEIPGLFTTLPETKHDYFFKTENDNYTSQYQRHNGSSYITAGKMLGGSSSLDHYFHLRGNPQDFDRWAQELDDDSWGYNGLLPYFIKSENVLDKDVLKSSTAKYHGTSGYIKVTRQPNPDSDKIIKAFEELGMKYNPDFNSDDTLGVGNPYLRIANGMRVSMANAYLTPIKHRSNLHVWKHTTVTKILFDNNNNAIGVQAVNSKGKTITVKANKEVIISAGAVKSPQLLMLSGIGPKSQLKQFEIPVISDLPVGVNFHDRPLVYMICKLDKSIAIDPNTALNPFKFPAPFLAVNAALNSSSTNPDYLAVMLYLPHDDIAGRQPQVCLSTFKNRNDICDKFTAANIGRNNLGVILSANRPLSKGHLRLNSTDPMAPPIIHTGYYSVSKDLDDIASYLMDFNRILNTTSFKKMNAEFVDLDLPECKDLTRYTWEYWRCYALAISSTYFQPIATCAMGAVVDTKLRVKGVNNLRVVDASVIPKMIPADMMSAVIAVAEKAADLIKEAM